MVGGTRSRDKPRRKGADERFEFRLQGRGPAREAARCNRGCDGHEPRNRKTMGGYQCYAWQPFSSFRWYPRRSAQTNRTELKRGDLTGTNMEIIISVLEVPPGSSIEQHTHPGEEAVYVLDGATLQFPDGKEVVASVRTSRDQRPRCAPCRLQGGRRQAAEAADGAYRRQGQADDGPCEITAGPMFNLYSITTNQAAIIALFRAISHNVGRRTSSSG